MLAYFVGILAVPKIIELTNRVLEEHVIPHFELKNSVKTGKELFPVGMDLALSEQEMHQLQKCGGLDILKAGARRHNMIAAAGKAHVCDHCRRLQP